MVEVTTIYGEKKEKRKVENFIYIQGNKEIYIYFNISHAHNKEW